ncbi:MAG: F0F1 ATP synthase subunit gamma [Rhizobiales bacterium]|nr:F0F1 ATP synthase subunit gamma [Hyphomicrobiales bacterium]
MAERLADLVTQIQNVGQLEAVVRAMRGIAASRAQQGRSLLAGIEAYADVVLSAIGQALTLVSVDGMAPAQSRSKRRGLILFCAEQGFAGAFSERILDAVMRDIEGATSLIIGTRGAVVASERGIGPAWTAPMAAHVGAIPSFANRIADALYDRIVDGAITHVDVVFSRSVPGGGIEINRHSLLPIDLSRFARRVQSQPPFTTLAPQLLLERLAAEYVFAQLCEAAMHAFAAENEARMMAMAAAKTNIESKLAGLSQRKHQLRQEEITTEIVELAAGSEALTRA